MIKPNTIINDDCISAMRDIEDDSNTSVYINKCRSRRGWIDKARIIKIEEYLDSKQ